VGMNLNISDIPIPVAVNVFYDYRLLVFSYLFKWTCMYTTSAGLGEFMSKGIAG
ncbi:unnamed protein product, partial [marine sediment metagenome]